MMMNHERGQSGTISVRQEEIKEESQISNYPADGVLPLPEEYPRSQHHL